jgi:hypothetical protein
MFYSLIMHLRAFIADDTLYFGSTTFENGTDKKISLTYQWLENTSF